MPSQPKYIIDAETGEKIENPRYKRYPGHKPDTRKGDRHKGKHQSGTHRTKDTFVGLDGEGITRPDGTHDYVLCGASMGEHIQITPEQQELSTAQCLDFVLPLREKYPHGIFVCYGGSYDANMMLSSLPKKCLQQIHDGKDSQKWYSLHRMIDNQEIALGYRPRKSLAIGKLVKRQWNEAKQRWDGTYDPSITIWDVSSFFRMPFVDALAAWFPEYIHDGILEFPDGLVIDLSHMRKMKRGRSTFTVDDLDEMRAYCLDETRALVKLMERLRDYLAEIGVKLSKWHGPGAIASALLEDHGVKQHVNESTSPRNASVGTALYDLYMAQKRAYSAGRVEQAQFGTYLGPVYNYDLHSAFPSEMVDLPSMHGLWRNVQGMSKRKYALIHVRWRFNDMLPWYPFFFRDDKGNISYPPTGEGWYYRPEIDVALQAHHEGKLPGKLEIVESWEYEPYDDTKPFAFIPDLYNQRLQWKTKEHYNPAEKVIKLALNSFYGKTVQNIGGDADNPPAFHQLFWAGWTTSKIRAKMFAAVMLAPESVIQITIDGIYSTVPLDLDLGDGLGQWEEMIVDGVICVQSGVYWGLKRVDRELTDAEQADTQHYWERGGIWYRLNPHYQGFDPGSLTVPAVMHAWANHIDTISVKSQQRFVTLASALALKGDNELWDAWRTWRVIERKLALFPTTTRLCPAVEVSEMRRGKRGTPDMRLVPTRARLIEARLESELSAPYRLKWEAEGEDETLLDGIAASIPLGEMEQSEL